MRSHDPKFPSASGKPGPDYKGPRDLPPLRLSLLCLVNVWARTEDRRVSPYGLTDGISVVRTQEK